MTGRVKRGRSGMIVESWNGPDSIGCASARDWEPFRHSAIVIVQGCRNDIQMLTYTRTLLYSYTGEGNATAQIDF